MPAYGKNLTPAEVTSLVTFLETLHPPNIAPARDSKEPAVPRVTQRSSAQSP
jgi:ubiquinol-cytochrome c reductase cytochrome b subunit